MPYSDRRFDEKLKELIKVSDCNSFLDVGPGSGKFGQYVREIKGQNVDLVGVEVDSSYITQFDLPSFYGKIYNEDIMDFIKTRPSFKIDFVYIGDCLEHLKKSEGLDLIHYLMYRSKIIVICFPDKYVQYAWQGHDKEAHLSAWFENDFDDFDYKYYADGFMRFVVIKGYLSDPEAVGEDL